MSRQFRCVLGKARSAHAPSRNRFAAWTIILIAVVFVASLLPGIGFCQGSCFSLYPDWYSGT